ncbi:MAG TPA: SWIM zinc finger domain-containing protein, partial [Blastocatellia bacterium]|nr:SWIM zinc finger domain-containing protein [Blastocatellia bacterium]
MNWTSEQILGLAPDASSAKAGQGLAAARHWQTLGCDDNTAWGLCQGSGKNPYQAQIDLSEPAFKCSCPSRKFPCKHALGLFLLLANQQQAFTETSPPDWVGEWLASRAKRAEQKAEKQQTKEKPVDEAAQAKRSAAREAKVAAGIRELELWLRDLVRNGLAAAQTQPPQFWERMAARLVDAQAPGLAQMVRDLGGAAASGDGWHSRLLERAGKLHLLLEGYKRLPELPEEHQTDIRALIGWTVNQDDLLSQPGARDKWLVLGQRVEQEERLRVQRVWLWGENSHRAAMILNFAHGQQPLDASLVTGTKFDAELVFYPGAIAQRALVKERFAEVEQAANLTSYQTVSAALAAYAAALARRPWMEYFPMPLVAVTPLRRNEQWMLRDGEARLLPLHRSFDGWAMTGMSGGRS